VERPHEVAWEAVSFSMTRKLRSPFPDYGSEQVTIVCRDEVARIFAPHRRLPLREGSTSEGERVWRPGGGR
jgi:hypothetical protein